MARDYIVKNGRSMCTLPWILYISCISMGVFIQAYAERRQNKSPYAVFLVITPCLSRTQAFDLKLVRMDGG